MHGVLGCADDCKVNIYYQDTYSIHLNYEDVNKMVDRYKDKYGLYLVGEDLGNFHVDLPPLYKDNEVYGVEHIFLGKHTYTYIYIYIYYNQPMMMVM